MGPSGGPKLLVVRSISSGTLLVVLVRLLQKQYVGLACPLASARTPTTYAALYRAHQRLTHRAHWICTENF